MNHSNDRKTTENGDLDVIGRLIRHGGERTPVDSERMERSREKVRNHWEQLTREQRAGRRTRSWLSIASAAGLVAVVGIVLVLAGRWQAPVTEIPVASIERVVGELQLEGQAEQQYPVAGTELAAGAILSTGPSDRAAIRLANGQSLRIDVNSKLVLNGADQLALDQGAVYIDTAGADEAGPVFIDTPLGTARDIGTQFQVRIVDGTLLVGVRDGLVEVDRTGRQPHEVNAGYQVRFAAAGQSEPEVLDTQDQDWRWIETVAPAFDIDGATLAEYLAWYADEQALELIWADAGSKARAEGTTLTGSIEGYSPRDSLSVVQRVAPFEYRSEDGRLWVEVN